MTLKSRLVPAAKNRRSAGRNCLCENFRGADPGQETGAVALSGRESNQADRLVVAHPVLNGLHREVHPLGPRDMMVVKFLRTTVKKSSPFRSPMRQNATSSTSYAQVRF
jgi:hypothetical protein